MSHPKYIPPAISIVSFHSERGYTLSIQPDALVNPVDNYIEMMMYESQGNNPFYQERETEVFIEHDSWNENNPNAFW